MKYFLKIIVGILFFSGCQKAQDSYNSVKPNPVFGTVTDVDGNVYKTVIIGKQKWMAENLRVTHFADSTPIPMMISNSGWGYLSSAAFCWYNNDSVMYSKQYGALYNWYAVRTGKLCPKGWSVPSRENYEALFKYLGGYLKAGGKLKEKDTLYWLSPNLNATNEWGFGAVGSGWRNYVGEFQSIRSFGFWWCADESDAIDIEDSYYMTMNYNSAAADLGAYPWTAGYCVRCMEN